MHIPSYVPEPIEIPGNVAEERWPVVVGFVRRVMLLHLGTLAVAIGLATAPFRPMPLSGSLPMLLGCLLGLSLMRRFGKGKPWEQTVSALLAPLLLFALGLVGKEIRNLGWPFGAVIAGPAVATLYVLFARRDLSFLGMFLMGLAGSSVAIFVACRQLGVAGVFEALALNAGYLFYYVYDLAALLTRRRLGEEWGAVLDLYRDVLNMFSYPLRVWRHWRKHRIWSLLK
ncbi:MAG: hypothetical protein U0S12_08740 [Fimbriimonadales bacterium]